MAGSYPDLNDNAFDLWKKIAWNFYNIALDQGATDLTPPNITDNRITLEKKVAYYTAAIS